MGQKSSTQKLQAEVTVPAGLPLVDALSLSVSTTRCWGRGKLRLARYTFPRQHWVSRQGQQVCRSKELQKLPFAKLRRLDASTDVDVKCILRGAPVVAASVPLARLLAKGERAVGRGPALFLFTLAGSEDAAADHGAAHTALSCSRRLCGSGGNAGENGGPGNHQLVRRQQQPGLPPESEEPATASLALGVDDHQLGHPSKGPMASDAIRSHKKLTADELLCPDWRTPNCAMEARAKADTLVPSASVPALVPELKPCCLRPPKSDKPLTLRTQDSDVPEDDLGESSPLAPHDDDPESPDYLEVTWLSGLRALAIIAVTSCSYVAIWNYFRYITDWW